MKAFIFSIALSVCGAQLIAQNSKSYDVDPFNQVSIQGPFEVTMNLGNSETVELEGPEDLIKYTTVRIKGDRLEILYERDQWTNWGSDKVMITIDFKRLTELDASGASRIEVNGLVRSEFFNLDCSGASNVKAEINTTKLVGDFSGASKVTLSGSAQTQIVELSGASSYRAQDLNSINSRLDLSGASSAIISTSEELIAEASGASSLEYYGNPDKVDVDSSGASSVRRKN